MSNELVRAAQKHIATTDDSTLKKEAGKGLAVIGGGGLALWGVAGFLSFVPLISLPLLLILSVVLGGYWWFKE